MKTLTFKCNIRFSDKAAIYSVIDKAQNNRAKWY